MTQANTLMRPCRSSAAGWAWRWAAAAAAGRPVADGLGLAAGATSPYRVAYVLLAVLLLVPLAQVVGLPRSAGAAVTGRG